MMFYFLFFEKNFMVHVSGTIMHYATLCRCIFCEAGAADSISVRWLNFPYYLASILK